MTAISRFEISSSEREVTIQEWLHGGWARARLPGYHHLLHLLYSLRKDNITVTMSMYLLPLLDKLMVFIERVQGKKFRYPPSRICTPSNLQTPSKGLTTRSYFPLSLSKNLIDIRSDLSTSRIVTYPIKLSPNTYVVFDYNPRQHCRNWFIS